MSDTSYMYSYSDDAHPAIFLVYDTNALQGSIQHGLVSSLCFFTIIVVLLRLHEYARDSKVPDEVESTSKTTVSV